MSIRFISFLIISSTFFIGCQNIFLKATRTVEKQSKEITIVDSFYSDLQKRYKLIIAYYSFNASGVNSKERRFIFCYNSSSSCTGYVYSKSLIQNLNNGIESKIDSIKVDQKNSVSILNELGNPGDWDLNYNDTNDDSADNFCFYQTKKQCFILHGLNYRIDFIYKTRNAISLLYAPERYEAECCQGNINRQKFIKIKLVMDSSLNSLLQ